MNSRIAACVLAAAMVAAAPATRQDDRQEKARAYQRLQQEMAQLFREGKYEQAAEKCQAAIDLMPKAPAGHYNLACARARLGKIEDAFAALTAAIDKGYNEPAHMREDEDLAPLRSDKRFDELLARARENEKKGPYEKGGEIKGVRTLEDFPEGGLRYRLRLPETATRDKPARLVIWLHPSGGSMNQVVEAMSPRLAERGLALLVLTQKQYMGWTGEEADRLMGKTLPAVAKIEGVDVARPILLGFSAGGQMALEMWKAGPERYGGLVLDAAYPVDMGKSRAAGRSVVMDLPQGPGIRGTPVFVIVGDKDQGGAGLGIWRQAAGKWVEAGVPLVIHPVANKGHQWLFGKEETEKLCDWLREVTAGKLPSGGATTRPAKLGRA